MSRIIFLTGAPQCSTIDWTSLPPISHILPASASSSTLLHDGTPAKPSPVPPPLSTTDRPAWRWLPLYPQHLPTGYSQLAIHSPLGHPILDDDHDRSFTSDISGHDRSFLTSTSDSLEDDADILSQFCDHSLALHGVVSSSPPLPSTQDPTTAHDPEIDIPDDTATSFLTTTSSISSPSLLTSTPPTAPRITIPPYDLIPLARLPTASQITALHPQTLTRTLLVAVLSVAAPRRILTRPCPSAPRHPRAHGRRAMDLIEVLVGDDSRAGFTVTFWFSGASGVAGPSSSSTNPAVQAEQHLRARVTALRPGQVVLLRNVALSVFRARVYGQSLRRGLTSVETALDGVRVRGEEDAGVFRRRVESVREWVLRFVGPPGGIAGGDNVERRRLKRGGRRGLELGVGEEILPPDTQ